MALSEQDDPPRVTLELVRYSDVALVALVEAIRVTVESKVHPSVVTFPSEFFTSSDVNVEPPVEQLVSICIELLIMRDITSIAY